MLLTFCFSFIILFDITEACIMLSGGSPFSIASPTLLAGITFILILLIYLSGNGKAFLLLFSKNLNKADLKKMKNADNALAFAIKTLPFICTFFMLMSVIYFYLNFFETQTLGINLATVIDSILYLAQGELLLLILRGHLKRTIICYMDEDDEATVHEAEPSSAMSNRKKTAATVIKILISIAVIIALAVIVILANTVNNSAIEPFSFWVMADIPGIVFAFIPSLLLLGVSCNFKSFFKGIAAVFKNEHITVMLKSVYENAFKTARLIFLFNGMTCSLISLLSILFNLEDKYALGRNFTFACIPLIYSLLVNLILLPVEGRLNRLSDGD